MNIDGSDFVVTNENSDEGLDQAWLVPEDKVEQLPDGVVEQVVGRYMKVDFPDSLAHDGDEGVLEGGDECCYVPVDWKES